MLEGPTRTPQTSELSHTYPPNELCILIITVGYVFLGTHFRIIKLQSIFRQNVYFRSHTLCALPTFLECDTTCPYHFSLNLDVCRLAARTYVSLPNFFFFFSPPRSPFFSLILFLTSHLLTSHFHHHSYFGHYVLFL
jgi:hypothetical protein